MGDQGERTMNHSPFGDSPVGAADGVVVYTAVFGGYDDPPLVVNPDPSLSYIFFTDDGTTRVPPPWQICELSPVFDDPQRDARRVKLLPHLFVGGYRVSVWVDANCQLLDLTADAILEMLADADIAVLPHQHRSCVYEESEAVLALQLDSPDRVNSQMAACREAGFPARQGLHATMFLVRRHNTPACRQFDDDWWQQVQRFSKRDQLSFDFVSWRSPAVLRTIPLSYLDNPVFRWPGTHKLPSRRAGAGPDAGAPCSTTRVSALANDSGPRHLLRMVEQPAECIQAQLATRGFADPVAVFSDEECSWLLENLERATEAPADWFKGRAVTSRAFYDAAVDWRIVSRISAALGEDAMLWGASLVLREPRQVHPWHSDIESCASSGRAVSVWIGLCGTRPETSLKVMPGSHRLDITVQEKAWQKGKRRHEIQEEDVIDWARECGLAGDPRLVPMRDGEALFFDGRLWHGSNNLSPDLTRTALLLQYASVETPIRIPELGQCEWPFRFLESPRPKCLMVKGRDRAGINSMVPPPMLQGAVGAHRLRSTVSQFVVPHEAGEAPGWRTRHQFRGRTAVVADLSCHVSALDPGRCPHLPHQHPEEEILVVLDGEVEVVLPGLDSGPEGGCRRLRAGQFAYYPAGFYHSLVATSQQPACYLMLKWFSDPSAYGPPLGPGVFTAFGRGAHEVRGSDGCTTTHVFEGPTAWLSSLHCHATVLEPGAGYPPHADPYDVVIVVLEGEVETLGLPVPSRGVIFCAAGEPHGMNNPGSTPARYLVFELHGGKLAAQRLEDEAIANGTAV